MKDYTSILDLEPEEAASAPTIEERAFESDQVQDLAKNSMDFLAALAMPAVF